MRSWIFIAFLVYSSQLLAQTNSTVVLSEIMFNASSGNNEFIELYNTSPVLSIDLSKYKIKYSSANPDLLIPAAVDSMLKPKSFAVILEGDYVIDSGMYIKIIPQGTLLFKTADNAFGRSGMANSSGRTIYLIGPANDTVETYTYSADNKTNYSDEKIILNQDDSNSNWENSKVEFGTPGFNNSVTPLNYDLEISRLDYFPKTALEGNDVNINIEIKNIGFKTANNFTVKLFNDTNSDSAGENNELLHSKNIQALSSKDSLNINLSLSSLKAGDYNLIASIIFSPDEDLSNNNKYLFFKVYPIEHNYNDVVVNEIMYAPLNGEPEWVELYNRTDSLINLRNWSISDNHNQQTITAQNMILRAKSFIVISKDSSILNYYSIPVHIITANFPSLNNSGDAVVIKDSLGIKIDSLSYLPSWGGSSGNSLERINSDVSSNDPSNWQTSKGTEGGTPGKINSVTQKDFDLKLSDIIFTPPKPLKGEQISISVKIKNKGKKPASFSIKLFEDTNLDTIPDKFLAVSNMIQLSPSDSIITPSLFTINDLQNKIGFLAKVIFDEDQDTSNNFYYKIVTPGHPQSVIVISEIMYDPGGGEPEWIELYNTLSDTINLKDWSITDVYASPKTTILKNNLFIAPKSYTVVSKDSSIYDYHRYIPSVTIAADLPVLNNDMDGIVLKDAVGLTIDSVLYSDTWGGTSGYSLERISSSASSNLQNNWGSSKDLEKSTPGRINSLSPRKYDPAVTGIFFDPQFPVPGDDVYPVAKVKNYGSLSVNNFSVEFYYDSDSNNVADKFLGAANGLNLRPDDSLLIKSPSSIPGINSKIKTAVRLSFANDEDTLNNYYEKSIEPGFRRSVLLINEVMYDPNKDEPEWFEILNVSENPVNIKNWSVSDILPSPDKKFITNNDVILNPGNYLIITKDSTGVLFKNINAKILQVNFGTLGNSADGIILYDFRNAVIDSLFYRSSWGGEKGYSLERISTKYPTNDSTNWGTSLDRTGSTPGKINSLVNLKSASRNDFVINEIMFDPDENNCEFIEFYNNSSEPHNIGGWKVEVGNTKTYTLYKTSLSIPAKAYFLLAADSSILQQYPLNSNNYKNILNVPDLGLSNSGDLILLKDAKGNIVDSVNYSEKWHNENIIITKNISLERINPRIDGNSPLNWSSSANPNGATPDKQNSIYSVNPNSNSSISISPNPFSPDDDGYQDFTIINYRLTQPVSQIRLRIFDNRGRLVRTLADNKPSGQNGSLVFNGLGDDGHPLRMGIYIIFLEAFNDYNGAIETLKTVVVVAGKL